MGIDRPRGAGAEGLRQRSGARPGRRSAAPLPGVPGPARSSRAPPRCRRRTCSFPTSRSGRRRTAGRRRCRRKRSPRSCRSSALSSRSGLLAWLRNPPSGLDDMRRAVNAAAPDRDAAPRAARIWWVAARLPRRASRARPTPTGWRRPRRSATGSSCRCATSPRRRSARRACCASCCTRSRKAKPATQRFKDVTPALPDRQPVPAPRAPGPGLHARVRHRAARGRALRPAFAPRRAEARLGAVRFRRAQDRGAVPRARHRLQGEGARPRQPAPDQAARRDRPGGVASCPIPYPRQTQILVIEMASAFLLVEHVHRPFHQSRAATSTQQIVDHGRLAARRGEGQVDRRAAGRRAPRPVGAHRRAAPARAGGEGDPRQPAARRAGARRLRARHLQARDAAGAATVPAPDARRAGGARLPARRAAALDLREADPRPSAPTKA